MFAADQGLLTTLKASLADGQWLDAATSTYPAVVLGSVAAQKLGIVDVADELRVRIGDNWFAVIGILNPVAAAEGLDRGALIGIAAAETYVVGADIAPERIYVRTLEGAVDAVRNVLPPTVNPETPEEVRGDAAIRCPRRRGRGQHRVHVPVPRARCRRPAGRWDRHRQRHGHRRHRAAQRDRAAPGPRCNHAPTSAASS